jgi:hypothetical protein
MNIQSTSFADLRFAVLNMLMHRREQLQLALDRQQGEGFTFDDVFEMVSTGRAFFFWNEDSSAVIEVRRYPGEVNLHVFIAAGSTDGLLKLYDGVSEWGKDKMGATKMTTLCRKGFKRKLKSHGWKEPQVWLTKEI